MPSFELYQPTQLKDAFALLDRYGKDGWKMAGRLRQSVVVQGAHQASQGGDRSQRHRGAQGHPRDRRRDRDRRTWRRSPRSSEIRSSAPSIACWRTRPARWRARRFRIAGTIGGNASQDARCWYYRSGLPCYRAGGTTCFADTPQGINREHALFESDRCVAVSPSDTAPALVALDAKFVVKSAKGERMLGIEDFFIGPKTDITRMTSLAPTRSSRRSGFPTLGRAPISTSRRSPTGTPGTSRW